MSARTLGGTLGLGVAALVAVFTWRTLRSDEASSDEAVRPAHAADRTAPSIRSIRSPGSPALPALPAPPAAPALPPHAAVDPHDAAFTDEPRDAAWASTTEYTLRERFRTLRGGRLAEAACRTRQCRLILVGSREQIGRTISELAGAHGLHGWATAVELLAPESHADGTVALRVYAQFSR
jgi:hypothetical protein